MDNRTRALSQAISIDGWISEFDDDGTATVHADIVFRKGAFGEGSDAKIRFKIALKRAEIVLRIPSEETQTVVRKSVARTIATSSGKSTTTKSQKTQLSGLLRGRLSHSPDASAEVEATKEIQKDKMITLEEDVTQFVEQHFTTEDDHYGWEIATNTDGPDEYLAGSPWDSANSPRFQIRQNKKELESSCTIVVEVRCAREDIEIIDLEEKNPQSRQMFRQKRNKDVNLAAAEQLIKDELLKSGFLEIPDLAEKHSRLLIADKIILVEDE